MINVAGRLNNVVGALHDQRLNIIMLTVTAQRSDPRDTWTIQLVCNKDRPDFLLKNKYMLNAFDC